MSVSHTMLSVFLASPGDLMDERKIAARVVDEVNQIIGKRLAHSLELIGWEQTVSAFGRPQSLINEDVDKCDLFVGMLWQRWGQPPNNGKNTSGFEEEYVRAVDRRERSQSPEISILLKDMEETIQSDQAYQVSKTKEFREKLSAEKKIFYETFRTPDEFSTRFRKIVTDFLLERALASKDASEAEDAQSRVTLNDQTQKGADTGTTQYFSIEEAEFLNKIVNEKPSSETRLSKHDIARLRLIASSQNNHANDDRTIGPHDANLIFLNRHSQTLSRRERLALIDSGLEHFQHQNAPIWYWMSSKFAADSDLLGLCSIYGTTKRRVNALNIMFHSGHEVLSDPILDRTYYFPKWFAEDNSSELILAALRYLGAIGTETDIPQIQLLIERSITTIKEAAQSAIISIMLRSGLESALRVIVEQQFNSVQENDVKRIFQNPKSLSTSLLHRCLNHNDSKVRSAAFAALANRKEISEDIAINTLADTSLKVRFAALLALVDIGTPYSIEAAKKVLVRSSNNALSGFSNTGDGELKEYKQRFKVTLPKKVLEAEAQQPSLYDQDAFFALCRTDFPSYRNKLIIALENGFSDIYDDALEYYIQKFELKTKTSSAREMKNFVCGGFVQEALSIVSVFGAEEDLPHLRTALERSETAVGKEIAEFFRKYGEWSDIPLIIEASKRPDHSNRLSILSFANNLDEPIARTLYQLGKDRFNELVCIEMPEGITLELVRLASSETFRRLSDETLISLCDDKRENVRRQVALKMIITLTKKRSTDLLDNYISRDGHRFYNTIFWLDLAASMPARYARNIAKSYLEN